MTLSPKLPLNRSASQAKKHRVDPQGISAQSVPLYPDSGRTGINDPDMAILVGFEEFAQARIATY